MAGIKKEIWLPVIENNFYSEWEILKRLAKDDSVYSDGTTLRIPNAGNLSAVAIDNTTYPVTHEERTDTIKSIDMKSYQMKPVRIGKYDSVSLTYDKALSVSFDFAGNLGEVVKYDAFKGWYDVDMEKVVTTGANTDFGIGNRKKIKVADVRNCAKKLDEQVVPDSGRILLLPSQMFYDLHESIMADYDIVNIDGLEMLNRTFLGFEVVKQPKVASIETSGLTINDWDHVPTSGDTILGYAYQKDQVSFSKGDYKFYSSENRPEFYGDLVSAETWSLGTFRRNDKKGVVPIYMGF